MFELEQGTAAAVGADRAYDAYNNSVFGGGGTRLSGAERNQNEMVDVANWLRQNGNLTPEERQILDVGMTGNETSDQLVNRYKTVNESTNQNFVNLLNQLRTAGNAQDSTQQYAYDTFRSTFGRGPTSTEFAQILPVFGGAEGRQRGAAAIASMYDQYKQSPEYLKTQAGQYAGQLDPMFDQYFGRDASESENDYFGQMLAGGRSAYEIEQMLKGTQEYQTNEDSKFRKSLESELAGYDQTFLGKAQEGVISRAKRQGSGISTSSALEFALAKVAGEITDKRGQYLANLSSQQYGGNKDAARADYTYGRDQYFGQQDYERRQRDSDREYYRSRADQDRDYERQQADYYDSIGRQNQSRGVLRSGDWINLGLQGANAYAQSQGGPRTTNFNYWNQ